MKTEQLFVMRAIQLEMVKRVAKEMAEKRQRNFVLIRKTLKEF